MIGMDGDMLCFVEVKYRSNEEYGMGLDAVNYRKQRSIVKVAQYYLFTHGKNEWTPCRFDVLSVDGDNYTLVQNAFEAHGW